MIKNYLAAVSDNAVSINNRQYDRNMVAVAYDRENAEYIRIKDLSDSGRNIVEKSRWDEIALNGTGLPANSLAEFELFLRSHVYVLNPSTAINTTNQTEMQYFFEIVAVPAAAYEKPIGATLQSDFLVNKQVAYVVVDSTIFNLGQITFNSLTGTLSIDALDDGFIAGMNVAVHLQQSNS